MVLSDSSEALPDRVITGDPDNTEWSVDMGMIVNETITDPSSAYGIVDPTMPIMDGLYNGIRTADMTINSINMDVKMIAGVLYENNPFTLNTLSVADVKGTISIEFTVIDAYPFGGNGSFVVDQKSPSFDNLSLEAGDHVSLSIDGECMFSYVEDGGLCKYLDDSQASRYFFLYLNRDVGYKGTATVTGTITGSKTVNFQLDYDYDYTNKYVGHADYTTATPADGLSGTCRYTTLGSGDCSATGTVNGVEGTGTFHPITHYDTCNSHYTVFEPIDPSVIPDPVSYASTVEAMVELFGIKDAEVAGVENGFNVAVNKDDAFVSKENVDALIANADTYSTITMSMTKDSYKVELDNTAMKNMKSEDCSMTLKDVSSTESGIENADVVRIVLGNNHDNFDGGNITVTIPYTGTSQNPKAYYVVDGKLTEPCDCIVNGDGTVTFTVNHLSTFAVTEEQGGGDTPSGDGPSKLLSPASIAIIIVGALAVVGLAAVLLRKHP